MEVFGNQQAVAYVCQGFTAPTFYTLSPEYSDTIESATVSELETGTYAVQVRVLFCGNTEWSDWSEAVNVSVERPIVFSPGFIYGPPGENTDDVGHDVPIEFFEWSGRVKEGSWTYVLGRYQLNNSGFFGTDSQ